MKKSKKQKLKEKCVKLASELKLKKYPHCMFCSKLSQVSHHFIRQSRSNYLRCDERNLIPICKNCHMRLHSGYESVMVLELVQILGDDWRDDLIKDSNIKIKDTTKYWTDLLEDLQK